MGVPDKQYPMTVYRLILMTAAAVWGLGFVIGKGAIGTVGATWFTAIRFLGAGVVLVILLFPHLKRNFCRKTLKAGLIIGWPLSSTICPVTFRVCALADSANATKHNSTPTFLMNEDLLNFINTMCLFILYILFNARFIVSILKHLRWNNL